MNKFIVIDGTDGSGKATQVRFLEERLVKEGVKVKTIDFPRYYDNFFGKLVGECLSGKYGDFMTVDSHIASVLYAADRWESSQQIKRWLDEGYVVIADRYVSSSQIHQGAKIEDDTKRKEFIEWLDMLEYGTFKIPRPDHIFFLSVPVHISQKLLAGKDQVEKKKYLEGRGDLAETNTQHLEDARLSAFKMIQESNNWTMIECMKDDELASPEEVHELLYKEVIKVLNLEKPLS